MCTMQNFPGRQVSALKKLILSKLAEFTITDDQKAHMEPTNRMPEDVGTESGWKFYAARQFLAGLFYWTGFDYRGESNPYNWPAVINQSGCVDLCGFPKDIFYYLKSWWGKEPVLHILPHWNWKGREGQGN